MNAPSPPPSSPSVADDVARCPFSSDSPESAFTGLNLVLELKDPLQMPELIRVIKQAEDEIRYRMKRLNSVHFARFLPTRGNTALQVITEFDGLLEDYLYDFVIVVGDIFNDMLGFIKNPPPLPIQADPDAFVDFVRRNNLVQIAPLVPDEVSVFSAYHDKTVREIVGKDKPSAAETTWWADHLRKRAILDDAINAPPDAEAQVPLDDVQAHTLEALPVESGLHLGFGFKGGDVQAARDFVRRLSALVTSQEEANEQKHGCALNVGFTAAGLRALGVPEAVMQCFPAAFIAGPLARAHLNRDVGRYHTPDNWALGSAKEPVHLLVSLHRYRTIPDVAAVRADSGQTSAAAAGEAAEKMAAEAADDAARAFEAKLARLRELLNDACVNEVFKRPVALLDGRDYHFGYRDQISQPKVALDGHRISAADTQPDAADAKGSAAQRSSRVGDFVLGAGFRNAFGVPSLGKLPAELGQNGCFGVIRLLEQDVEGFERAITPGGGSALFCKEYLAAKIMGRWRNGMPLTQHGPINTTSHGRCGPQCQPAPGGDVDAFDFRHTALAANSTDDPDDFEGRICPIGSHIRRMNPRNARAVGVPWAHRIIRRGMPYGSPWTEAGESGQVDEDAGQPGKIKRGLFGVFYCTDIARQFEFLQQRWGYDSVHRDKPMLDIEEKAIQSALRTREAASKLDEEPGPGDPFCGAWVAKSSTHASPAPGAGSTTPGSAAFSFPFDSGTEARQTLHWDKPLVQTRGSLYLFVPGLSGLTHLAEGEALAEFSSHLMATGKPPMVAKSSRTRGPAAPTEPMPPGDLERFNPLHPAFIADPYPYYAALREKGPAVRIRIGQHYSQVWVLSHDLVKQVCEDEKHFAKPLNGWPRQGLQYREDRNQRVYRGLMYLDGQRHTEARQAIEPVLEEAIGRVEQIAIRLAERALSQIRLREFDAVPAYINRVPREVFMTLAGLPEAKWETFGTLVERMLAYYNPLLTPAQRAPYGVASREFLAELTRLTPESGPGGGLFAMLQGANHGLKPLELLQTCLHFALGGYLSSSFALGNGMSRLLSEPSLRDAFKQNPASTLAEMLRHDAPFQTVERRFTGDTGTRFPLGSLGETGRYDKLAMPLLVKDETITVVLGSALRDPTKPDPANQAHDAGASQPGSSPPSAQPLIANEVFGFGPHKCIGAALATRVLPIYFARWFARMPHLELAPAAPERMPVRIPDPSFRGFQSLWLRY